MICVQHSYDLVCTHRQSEYPKVPKVVGHYLVEKLLAETKHHTFLNRAAKWNQCSVPCLQALILYLWPEFGCVDQVQFGVMLDQGPLRINTADKRVVLQHLLKTWRRWKWWRQFKTMDVVSESPLRPQVFTSPLCVFSLISALSSLILVSFMTRLFGTAAAVSSSSSSCCSILGRFLASSNAQLWNEL